jgi:hypothetical protein
MQPQRSEDSVDADFEGHELFRRAIEERDEQAWAEGTARYRPLIITWAACCGAGATISEGCDEIADYAFARAWVALAPAPFARFPTLAALLAYLRTCVATAVIDCARNETQFVCLSETIEANETARPEQVVLDQLDRSDLWRIVSRVAKTEREQRLLIASYMYILPPRVIMQLHPELFANVAEIYTTKRSLLNRLKHCPEMRQFYREWIAA